MRETGDYKTVKETQKEYEDPDYFYGEISTCEVDSHSSRPDSSKRIVTRNPDCIYQYYYEGNRVSFSI
ncbi:hypothetical protein ANCCAN_22881 [Ancylostoma caninum]|uniref:Uncharacterized protein n=1 Tax=Ancylostoma caninum TaxID=29170 RepID=A0A368FGG8_ANCCA|nr:hypothetical protein ANCCAN_22881 [Ancylostoma caninum]